MWASKESKLNNTRAFDAITCNYERYNSLGKKISMYMRSNESYTKYARASNNGITRINFALVILAITQLVILAHYWRELHRRWVWQASLHITFCRVQIISFTFNIFTLKVIYKTVCGLYFLLLLEVYESLRDEANLIWICNILVIIWICREGKKWILESYQTEK